MNVVEFPIVSLADIPARLRKLADDMDAGEVEIPDGCTVMCRAQDGRIFGFWFGAFYTDTDAQAGFLFRAAHVVAAGEV